MKPRQIVYLTLALATLAPPALAADGPPTYERDVKPLLAKRCTACHNVRKIDDADTSAGLALDTYEAALKGTKDHAVIVPGKADGSELYKRLGDPDDDRRMPLADKALPGPDQTLIRRWIDAGAPRGEPIAIAPVKKPARRLARSLDVTVPVDAKVPPSTKGLEPGGPVQFAWKVGPLPAVTSIAFRGDGRCLAVGSYGSVVVWDLVDGRPSVTLSAIPGPVLALAFSRDGKRLAVGSGLPARTGVVRVYDVPGGALLNEFDAHGDVVSGLSFRPDGGRLASGSYDQTVRVWDLIQNRPAGVFRGHSDFVYDIAFDPSGKTILSVSKDHSIKRIDAVKLKELRTYSEHNEDVLAVAVSPTTGEFVTAGNEPQVRWWKPEEEKSNRQQGGHGGPVHQLAFSADGSRLISAGGDGSARTWDGRTGAPLKTLSIAGSGDWQYAVALSADGAVAASGGSDGLVRVWDASAGTFRATLLQPPGDGPDAVEWAAVVPCGYLVVSPGLAKLTRWRVGGKDVPAEAASAAFAKPEALAQALRGQPVPPAFK